MNEDQVRSKLKAVVSGEDRSIDWAWNKYEEFLENNEDNHDETVSEEDLQEYAIRSVSGKLLKNSRTSPAGEMMECEVLAIGHSGFQSWGDGADARDVLIAYGVVQPKPTGDEDMPQQIGVFQCDANSNADIGLIKDKFHPTYNTFRGWFSIRDSSALEGVYHLECEENTRVEDLDVDANKQALRDEVDKHFDASDVASIDSVASYLSQQESDSGYLAEFGGDLRKMEGVQVIDYYRGDGFNTLTFLDNSISNPDQLGSDVISTQARSPGMTGWVDDDFMEHGANSQLELYGSIRASDDGQISMNVVGVNPILSTPIEDDEWGGDDGEDQTTVERI